MQAVLQGVLVATPKLDPSAVERLIVFGELACNAETLYDYRARMRPSSWLCFGFQLVLKRGTLTALQVRCAVPVFQYP